MRDIDAQIREYCSQYFTPEPAWLALLNRRCPKIAARFEGAKSLQLELEGHLRDSYEAILIKEQNPERAWTLAQERFGDVSDILREILKAHTQSIKCLTVRLLAIIAVLVLPLGKMAQFSLTQFFKPSSLLLMVACAAVGFLITRKRDAVSLRRYAFYGSWLGLFWGIVLIIKANDPSRLGEGVAMILMATFYGLFLAAPKARGIVPLAMMLLCHAGVLTSMARFGLVSFYPVVVDGSLLKMIAGFSIIAVLVGLAVFDVRRIHHRLAGMAVFSMVFAYIQILSNLTRGNASLFILVLATTIPPVIAVMNVFPIQKLQRYLLCEAN